MANIKSAKKSFLASKIQRKYNASHKSMLRTFIKKINTAINFKNAQMAQAAFITMQKIIDRQTTKGLIHKNKAARYKSNIYKRIKSSTLSH